MPGRISRSSLPSAKAPKSTKGNRKRKQRTLDAYAIAEKEAPALPRARGHRLGEAEGFEPRRKKQRLDDDEDEEEDIDTSNAHHQQVKKGSRGQSDDLDFDSGSDSEGNEWRMGVVNDDDDSDIDSDEAFGESDEERFAGFTFRGGSGEGKKKKKARTRGGSAAQIDLNESDENGNEDDDDLSSLGEDAVDLATMLDYEDNSSVEDEVTMTDTGLSGRKGQDQGLRNDENDSFDGFEEGNGSDVVNDDEELSEDISEFSVDDDQEQDEDATSESSLSDAEADDDDPAKLRLLRNLARSMAVDTETHPLDAVPKLQRDAASNADRMLNALKTMSGMDPELTRSLKRVSRAADGSKSNVPNGMVSVPLPINQQRRLERSAANQKAVETLSRWNDTVKHNRRAEHLTFPLVDHESQVPQGATHMLPTTNNKPQTELESTIQDIMRASGLLGPNQKSEEDQIMEFEGLQANRMSKEEAEARHNQLRKDRDLLFREERRAKRISKIKSKAYRRVHRKEAERNAQKQRDLLAAAGIEMSEDEKESNDRRRAEERVSARHRAGKWAKSAKATGRTAWDEDARDAVSEMARKNDELRRRMEGKTVRNEDDSGSDSADVTDDDDDEEDSDGAGADFKLRRQVDGVLSSDTNHASNSKLGALQFMQRADAARKQRNDETAEQIRREVYGDEEASDADEREPADTSVGRRIFGPTRDTAPAKPVVEIHNELEEGHSSDSETGRNGGHEDSDRAEEVQVNHAQRKPKVQIERGNQRKLSQPRASAKPYQETSAIQRTDPAESKNLPLSPALKTNSNAPNTSGWTTVPHSNPKASGKANGVANDQLPHAIDANSDNEETNPAEDPFLPSNDDLVRLAFGDADVDASFAAEKDAAAASEDEQTTDTALPGWGSWAGEGVSKRELKRAAQRNAGRFIKVVEPGIKRQDRKDTKLKDVIVSEKRVKKNAKYLAGTLPHPYESRAQYERSLRVPVGPEWNTKVVFQDSIKPRVMVKRGVIVEPMKAPMI